MNQTTLTTNGMVAYKVANANLAFFENAGAMRGTDIIPMFADAYNENNMLALMNALHIRDIRAGKGERELFRKILRYVESVSIADACVLIRKIPEIGRWDDIFSLQTQPARDFAFDMVATALLDQNSLCAKWMPRKGADAVALRNYLKLTPKSYRKLLVGLTNVVETKMCNNEWESINFSHVPSQATRIYKNAFQRHTENYTQWLEKLKSGDSSVKVNAGAITPVEVCSYFFKNKYTPTDVALAEEQWKAIPREFQDMNMICMVDSSASMLDGSGSVSPMQVAFAIGTFVAENTVGLFKNKVLTFSETSSIIDLAGSLENRLDKLKNADWGGRTNYVSAFTEICNYAKSNNIADADMPKQFVVISDMQFNESKSGEDAITAARRIMSSYGYSVPTIVYWNVNSSKSVVSTDHEKGVVLVSGYSEKIANNFMMLDQIQDITPMDMMIETIMVPRYID